jgi:hypothetical protein
MVHWYPIFLEQSFEVEQLIFHIYIYITKVTELWNRTYIFLHVYDSNFKQPIDV